MKTILKITVLLQLITIYSCDQYEFDGKLINDKNTIAELYSKSKDTISIDKQKLTIESYIYRNFFPGGLQEEDHRLIVNCDLLNCKTITKVDAKSLFVINAHEAWLSKPKRKDHNDSTTIKYSSSEGPEWPTGHLVDVILHIEIDNKPYFLISRNNEINKHQ